MARDKHINITLHFYSGQQELRTPHCSGHSEASQSLEQPVVVVEDRIGAALPLP